MGSDWFSNIALNVQPWPVEIAAGKTITLDGAIDIMQEIEVGSGLNLKLTLITAIGNLPIPCLPIGELNIGSCDYDVQHLLDELKGADGVKKSATVSWLKDKTATFLSCLDHTPKEMNQLSLHY